MNINVVSLRHALEADLGDFLLQECSHVTNNIDEGM